jgi:hypothetical protein
MRLCAQEEMKKLQSPVSHNRYHFFIFLTTVHSMKINKIMNQWLKLSKEKSLHTEISTPTYLPYPPTSNPLKRNMLLKIEETNYNIAPTI